MESLRYVMKRNEKNIHNFKADGAIGGGIAFAIVGDHENRPTDMTNVVIINERTDSSGIKSESCNDNE